jgi:hypothetical protein
MKETAKTEWITLDVKRDALIKNIPEEKPYYMISLSYGVRSDGSLASRKDLSVNGITTIISKKLVSKYQVNEENEVRFVFPESFEFNIIETKFNEKTRVYDDVRNYKVSAKQLTTLL